MGQNDCSQEALPAGSSSALRADDDLYAVLFEGFISGFLIKGQDQRKFIHLDDRDFCTSNDKDCL